MRICIATGIYPPATSGPAQYAAAMEAEFKSRSHQVSVVTYGFENKLPTGVRHLWYFLRVLPRVAKADFILALDTFSVGLPTVLAAKLAGRKIIIRTGGDFLYEQYIDRTGEKILLRKFYTEPRAFNRKEKIIFALTRWTLQQVSALVFSTEWQRDIFLKPYKLEAQKIFVVENRFDKKISDEAARAKNFIFATRNIAYKNIEKFSAAFEVAKKNNPEISLEIYHTLPHDELMKKIATCYAVVMPSLGEISPHVSGKIEWLVNDIKYARVRAQVRSFSFTHSWAEIADELLSIYSKI
ncbi:MAG: hypothetical protein NT003_01970 [Candidatus Magasanikbacteria bacterium]|nr:hypothetical protein [Candidatus Magasanikbacteria bacterium]